MLLAAYQPLTKQRECSILHVQCRATLTSHQNDDSKMVYTVATIIRGDISQCKGINLQPLNVDDLSMSNSRVLLPTSLYWFLRWVVTGEEYESGKEGFREMCKPCSNIADNRKIIMNGLDLVHCVPHARVKLPKYVSLGISVRHLTGSKQLITILNRMGHCCSYEEVELVDTSLANEILAKSDETGVTVLCKSNANDNRRISRYISNI